MSSPQRPTAVATDLAVPVAGADAAPSRDERPVPPPVAPPGRRLRVTAGALAVALGAVVLAGCGSGGTSSSVNCSGSQCRATVTGAPVDVSQPGTTTTRTKVVSAGKTTTKSVRRSGDGVDFSVAGQGPGWVDIDEDGVVTRVPVGGTFSEDGSTVRLQSADGRTAVFTFGARR